MKLQRLGWLATAAAGLLASSAVAQSTVVQNGGGTTRVVGPQGQTWVYQNGPSTSRVVQPDGSTAVIQRGGGTTRVVNNGPINGGQRRYAPVQTTPVIVTRPGYVAGLPNGTRTQRRHGVVYYKHGRTYYVPVIVDGQQMYRVSKRRPR